MAVKEVTDPRENGHIARLIEANFGLDHQFVDVVEYEDSDWWEFCRFNSRGAPYEVRGGELFAL